LVETAEVVLGYPGIVSTERAMATFEELAEAYKNAPVPTADDVTVLFDGRRLDSKAKVLGWLVEIEADRAAGRSALDELP
jgi:hypothetical protein